MKQLALWITMVISVTFFSGPAAAAKPDLAELWKIVEEQNRTIQQLKNDLAETKKQVKDNEIRVESTVVAMEEGGGSSGSTSATGIHGYGEHHYNHLKGKNPAVDAHRMVIMLQHPFNSQTDFVAELELEHGLSKDTADGSGPGEVELEQAYIQHRLTDRQTLRLGQFLMPVGLLNETHEPDRFYGVERNPVESMIIPTTWWETGIYLQNEFRNGWGADLALTSGLKSNKMSIRGGRQKSAKATVADMAWTGRLRYSPMPGLKLATTFHFQEDMTQGTGPSTPARLFEINGDYRRGKFGLKALYARWNLDSPLPGMAGSRQVGWFVEPSWRVSDRLGLFTRVSRWDTAAGDSTPSQFEQRDIGLNYWLADQVVLKLDVQKQFNDPAAGKAANGYNMGIGWSF